MKSFNKDEIIKAMFSHLHHSPYHNIPKEEAEALASEDSCIEEFAVEYDPSQELLEAPIGAPAAKRPRAWQQLPAASGSSSAPLALEVTPSELAQRQVPQTGIVAMLTGELAIILDSIKRAAANVRNAERVCESAATAFRMEATALETAHAALSMQIVQQQTSQGRV